MSDFEGGTATAMFGIGWSISLDSIVGGKSSAEMKVVERGANGSSKSLATTGTISPAVPFAWAGPMFSPGQQLMAPVNLSSKKEVSFWAKGDGKTYRVMIFSESKGRTPSTRAFIAGSEWKEYIFPLSAFDGFDGHDITALLFAAGPEPATFTFQVDDVRFR